MAKIFTFLCLFSITTLVYAAPPLEKRYSFLIRDAQGIFRVVIELTPEEDRYELKIVPKILKEDGNIVTIHLLNQRRGLFLYKRVVKAAPLHAGETVHAGFLTKSDSEIYSHIVISEAPPDPETPFPLQTPSRQITSLMRYPKVFPTAPEPALSARERAFRHEVCGRGETNKSELEILVLPKKDGDRDSDRFEVWLTPLQVVASNPAVIYLKLGPLEFKTSGPHTLKLDEPWLVGEFDKEELSRIEEFFIDLKDGSPISGRLPPVQDRRRVEKIFTSE